MKEQGDLVRQLKADKASKEVNKEPILKIQKTKEVNIKPILKIFASGLI